MEWSVEYTDEFGLWWDGLTEEEQEDVATVEQLLEKRGPNLPFPYSSDVKELRHGHMRELRIQSGGKPLRVFYAFNPRRTAICLSVATKQEMTAFTTEWFRLRMTFTMNICGN